MKTLLVVIPLLTSCTTQIIETAPVDHCYSAIAATIAVSNLSSDILDNCEKGDRSACKSFPVFIEKHMNKGRYEESMLCMNAGYLNDKPVELRLLSKALHNFKVKLLVYRKRYK